MSRRELIEWRAWYGVEPRGEDRADWLTGWLAMMVAAVNTPRRARKRLGWREFVPRFRAPPPAEPVKLSDQVRTIFGRFKRKA